MTSGTTTPDPGPDRSAASPKRRQRQPFAFRRHHFTVTGVLDYLFFLFAGASSTWLAVLILFKGFSLGWWQVLTLLVFWVVVSYLALPRLHRILSQNLRPQLLHRSSPDVGRTARRPGQPRMARR